MFIRGEILPGINEKLEKADSAISSNIAKYEAVSKNAGYIQYYVKKDLGFIILAALLPTELNIHFTQSQNGRGWKGPLWVI